MTSRFERETIRDYVQFRFRDAAIAEEFGAVYGEIAR